MGFIFNRNKKVSKDGIFPCENEKPSVFHELVSDIVHIDVNIIPSDNGRDYYVLWTSGMSDRQFR